MLGFIAADVIRFSDDKATVTQVRVVMGLDNSKGAIVVKAVVSAMKHVRKRVELELQFKNEKCFVLINKSPFNCQVHLF